MVKVLTSGNPFKQILNFTIPILIGNLIQQFYAMIDSMFVGQYVGMDAFTGVSNSSYLNFLIFGFVFGISNGCSIILAQKFGAKSKHGVKICITSSIYIYILISIITTIVSILTLDPTLNYLNTPIEILDYSKKYAIINYAGIFAIMGYNLFSQMLRSFGDNMAALVFLIISSVLNAGLDWLFVAILKFGVEGAAIATIIAEALSAVLSAIYMFYKHPFARPSRKHWKFNKFFFLKQLKLGLPIAFETSVCAVGLLILQRAVNELGSIYISGFAIAMKIEDLLIVVFFALANAASVFTAQNFGAAKYSRIKQGARASILIGLICCFFCAILFLTSWDLFVKLFINEADVLQSDIEQVKLASKRYIDIVLLHYPGLCLLIILRNVVQSLGKTLIPFLGSVAEVIARIFGAVVLGKILKYDGICYCTILSWYLALILILSSYFSNMNRLNKHQQ